MRKRWYAYLGYPLPERVPIDDAIRLAKLEADMASECCSLAGGYDGGGGQAMEVDKDYAELEQLRELKKKGLRFVTIFSA